MDPDQMILRPFTNDFSNAQTELWRPTPKSGVPLRTKVEHGSPMAQQYAFGIQWLTKLNTTAVVGPTSRVVNKSMSLEEAKGHYIVGPPYVATAKDMYNIALKWTEFVPKVHHEYPHLLAEMFAYCLAAAHLNLPHRTAHSFMISDPGAGGEGWKLVDRMDDDEVCQNNNNKNNKNRKKNFPHVLHYCHRYMIGKYFMTKYRLRKDFISNCEAPLLKEPPHDVYPKFKDYQITPDDGERHTFHNPQLGPKRHAFVLCQLLPKFNEAAKFYKDHHCNNNNIINNNDNNTTTTANYNQTYIFHANDEGM